MKGNVPAENGGSDQNKGLPPIGMGVQVEHEGCKCFAYLDSEGKWRNYYNGDVLCGEVCVLKAD